MTEQAVVALVTAVITAIGATKGREKFNQWRFKRNGSDRRAAAAPPARCSFNPGIPADLKGAIDAGMIELRGIKETSENTYRLLYASIEKKGDFDLSLADKPKGSS